MRTNIFNVKENKENKIIIEEEKTKNPFLLFLKKHKNFLLLTFILLGICTLLVSIGLAFSMFQQSSDFDISYLDGSTDEITTNNDPNIKDEDVANELLGEISRSEGVVLLVKTFLDKNNNVIYYFSDKSSIIVQANGKIYRVSSTKDGKYGIDENGNIDSSSKKILVKSSTTTLEDGTIITYYSDGTAKVDYNGVTIFVRDSNNIKLNAGVKLNNVVPTGVSISDKIDKRNTITMITYTDNTRLVIDNETKYIVNPKVQISTSDDSINYDKNNSFGKFGEKILSDGNTVTYFENGTAIITDSSNNTIYVKKSGDIVIKDNKIYEIITNKYGYSKKTVTCSDGKQVTYFDNGAAIVKYKDGTKQYIEDSDEITYDSNKNIASNPTSSKQVSIKKTTDGYDVVNFDNGKSEVIKKDGTSFIIDTNKLIFDTSGNITSNEPETSEKEPDDKNNDTDNDEDNANINDTPTNPLEGMYVSEADNKYNYSKSIEYTNFIIKNTNTTQKKFRIVIEEVDNYNKYGASRLEPKFVKFQATIGDNLISPKKLNDDTWEDENGKINYVIYDGTINAKSTLDVALSLYVDYAELDNSYQNKAFIGTIKVYVNE